MGKAITNTGIIVIGRNEGARLLLCLRSLQTGGAPLVYVDSASTDASVQAAIDNGADVLQLDMTRPFTAARARAEGTEQLLRSYPDLRYVMFVDGDCEVEDGWPLQAENFLDAHPGYAVVCGRRRERFPTATRYNALADAEWNTPVGEAESCGGDSVVRITAYQKVGGFNAQMIAGEEPELCSRLRSAGWRIMRLDAAMTIHDAAMSRFSQWWQRSVRSGFGYAQAFLVTRTNDGPTLYYREMMRAIFWAFILPCAAILAAFVHPAALLIWPLATLLQFLRMAIREEAFSAMLSVTGKYAELLGILRYGMRRLLGKSGGTISYK
jgi:GT2 family glycosyltransferase